MNTVSKSAAVLPEEFEIGAQIGLVVPPGDGDFGIFLVPVFSENLQRVQGGILIHRCVYRFKVSHKCFQIFVQYIPGKITDRVDDTILSYK